MDSVRVKAYAKINLSLDILGRQDGYHMLDSVVTTIDVYDLIVIKKRKKDKLVSVLMKGMGSESIPYEGNNAVKAAERFIAAYDTCGVDITIYKNIPMGAGLGGSSADVAGVLNGLKKLFDIDDEGGIKSIADGIGSDCGYMLYGGYARIRGRGERVELLNTRLRLDLCLLIPKEPVGTAECYKCFDKLNCTHSPHSDSVQAALLKGDRQALGEELSNALTPSAMHLNGQICQAFDSLREFAPLGVSMTGSGSCAFALFENDQFASYAVSRYNGQFKMIQTKTYFPNLEISKKK
jgi:4-diphosphocytidyl-2-C-methyl-D-erythritol kinase